MGGGPPPDIQRSVSDISYPSNLTISNPDEYPRGVTYLLVDSRDYLKRSEVTDLLNKTFTGLAVNVDEGTLEMLVSNYSFNEAKSFSYNSTSGKHISGFTIKSSNLMKAGDGYEAIRKLVFVTGDKLPAESNYHMKITVFRNYIMVGISDDSDNAALEAMYMAQGEVVKFV